MTTPSLPSLPTRRQCLGSAIAMGASAALVGIAANSASALAAPSDPPARNLKLGLIGCGGRGMWLTKHFKQHGGYTFHAVADYFDNVAAEAGEKLGVDKARRFSGLSGYKRLLESGVEAVMIEDVPYFYPEQARAAVDAGIHVYMAKPVAVDVPGTLAIGEAGKLATKKNLCFLVDYQLPSEPAMIEIAARIRDGALGTIAHVASFGLAWQGWPDPPLGKTIESRLRDEIWLSDTALSGDTLVSYDIHILDAILAVGIQRPVNACGRSRICRPQPNGDRTDAAAVLYETADGVIWTHTTQSISNNFDITTLSASLFGLLATAHIRYDDKVYIRGGAKSFAGKLGDVYTDGAVRNIVDFHRNITTGKFDNPSVPRAVDGTLTAILGREAAARRKFLTMDELIKENKPLPVSLAGLKA